MILYERLRIGPLMKETKVGLKSLVKLYADKVRVHATIETARIGTGRKERGPTPTEIRLSDEIRCLKAEIDAAIDSLPIT